MATTEQRATVLHESAQLQAAREALHKASRRLSHEAVDAQGIEYGRLLEAIDVAESAIFNVLSTAACFLDCTEARAAIDRA